MPLFDAECVKNGTR